MEIAQNVVFESQCNDIKKCTRPTWIQKKFSLPRYKVRHYIHKELGSVYSINDTSMADVYDSWYDAKGEKITCFTPFVEPGRRMNALTRKQRKEVERANALKSQWHENITFVGMC